MTGFHKATRRRMFIKLAITGPSGSGKTYSALQLARGLGSKVAMIDTENGSGEAYSGLCDYDALTIEAPFTVHKYVQAIKAAEQAGYDVLIIDSLTHCWAGDGGLLQQKEALDARGGNSYTNWATITKQHEQFKAIILQAKVHVITTMRSKQEYILQENNRGKQAPIKVGMAPVQREGMEYEFTTVFDIAMNHEAETSKDRTGLFDGIIGKLTPDHGKLIADWLDGGAEMLPDAKPEAADCPPIQPAPKPAQKPATAPKPKPATPAKAETKAPTWRDEWPLGRHEEYRCISFTDNGNDRYWIELDYNGVVASAAYIPSTDTSRDAAAVAKEHLPTHVSGIVVAKKDGKGNIIPAISKVSFKGE